jgi:putative DNA primase/helicase
MAVIKPIRPVNMAETAAGYARRGWAVIPLHTPEQGVCSCGKAACGSPGKHPRTMTGLKGASADPAQVARWWSMWPEANIGIVCGAVSGLVVLDVDGPEGEESLKALEAAIGPLPETVEALTGKGRHLYFAHPSVEIRPSAGVLGPGLDVRGDGGYVVGPPSLHYTGRRYEWEVAHHPDDMDPAALPEAWVLKLKADKPKKARTTDPGETIPEGRRNDTLTSKAGSMRRAGFSADEILAALLTMNEQRCDPPLEIREVETIARSVARYEPAPQTEANAKPKQKVRLEIRETDLGNARRLVRLHGENLRYCHPWRKWLVWTGTHWEIDDTGSVERWAKATVREIYNEAAAEPQDERRQALVKHALRSESLNKINAMVSLAESEPGIPVRPEELDRNPWLLNCQNGTLNLKTMALYTHRRDDLLTNVLPVPYDASAQCPQWEAFLSDIFAGNKALIEFVQKAIGYSLTGITDERCMFILYGTGRNGKSTFVDAIATMLEPYAMQTQVDTLTETRQGTGPTNEIARLRGARFVRVSESDEGRRFAEGKVKDLTGQDRISARFLYAETFEFVPEFKLWMATNYKPVIRGTDPAIWDRIRLIPFTVRIPDAKIKAKREIMAEFEAEMAGILAWAVAGCVKWQTDGLKMPEAVKTATEGYREEMDVLAGFLDDYCIIDTRMTAKASDLYKAYKQWCEENGEVARSQRWLGGRLTARGFDRNRGTGGAYWWYGVGLRDPQEQ